MTKVERRELRGERAERTGGAVVEVRTHSDSHLSPLTSHLSHGGFTLVELLVTILIISILAAALLGVAAVAGETAREAKTKNMIARIHTLLMERYDSYKSRRVKVRQIVLDAINSSTALNARQKGQARAEARLYALREMMLMEMPDRWSDLLLTRYPQTPRNPIYLDAPTIRIGTIQCDRTELAALYLRLYQRAEPTEEHQSAECLYMLIVYGTGDGEARTLFPESNVGDTDGDGAPEFIDGWGNPISFMRWAPGFVSDIQINANELGDPSVTGNQADWLAAAGGDHDPFDLFHIDPPAYRLVPLVFSAGGDGEAGLYTGVDSNTGEAIVSWQGSRAVNVAASPPYYLSPRLSPYFMLSNGFDAYLGTGDDVDKTFTDNIDNHLISTR